MVDYYFKASALRDLRRLPKSVQKRIINNLDLYTKSDNPLKFAKPIKIKELGEYRFRIGDYKVIFDLYEGKIFILVIGHRKDIYR